MTQIFPYPRPAAAAVVWSQDRVLLVAKKNPPNAGQWGFPGGKHEMGESSQACAVRECLEETQITVKAQDIVDVLNVMDPSPKLEWHYVLVLVTCEYISGTAFACDDALEVTWADPDNLPTPLIDSVTQIIQRTRPKATKGI